MKYLTSHAAGEHSIELFSIAHTLCGTAAPKTRRLVYKLENPHAQNLRCAPNTTTIPTIVLNARSADLFKLRHSRVTVVLTSFCKALRPVSEYTVETCQCATRFSYLFSRRVLPSFRRCHVTVFILFGDRGT